MNFLLDLLFPKKCVGCQKEGEYFCQNCVSNILQTDLFCPGCGNKSIGGLSHPHCETMFGLDGLWSLGIYQGPLKKAIQKLKYEPSLVKDIAYTLASVVINYWDTYKPYFLELIKKDQGCGWVVIAVPIHWYKINKRGFNQSELIGQILSKNLRLNYCNGLKKTRFTHPQVGLKKHQRKQNISGSFEIAKPYTLNPSPYVLLIDDVWTTGITLKECCYVLKKAGAKKVWALTIAR